jgi:hypothetical protein
MAEHYSGGALLRGVVALRALEFAADVIAAAVFVRDPLAILPRGIVAHMLRVAALQVRDPVPAVILMERYNFARDYHRPSVKVTV